jgi:hypothetical protein
MEDIIAIVEFLKEIDNKKLIQQLEELEELDEEYLVAKEDLKQINLKRQIEIINEIIKMYQYFQNDADINGIRLKTIVKEIKKRAKKEKIKTEFTDLLW